jgi:hypothetical protein
MPFGSQCVHKSLLLILIALCLLAVGACRPKPMEYRPMATVKDIMDSLVEPAADALWGSVTTIVTSSGTEERAPHTDKEWANARRQAIQVIEATNLLIMPGRHIAGFGEKNENSKVELAPEQIEMLVNRDPKAWTVLAHGLYDAGLDVLQAIDAKNANALSDAGAKLDTACENCHARYWYPVQSKNERD